MSKIICLKCKGSPCICHYVERLGSGAISREVARVAVARMLEKHQPRLDCPCVECYRVRLGSWEVSS